MRLKKKQNDMLKKNGKQIMPKVCPMDGHSTREYVKNLIVTLSIKNPHVKANIMGAIKRNNIDGWKDTTQRKQSN